MNDTIAALVASGGFTAFLQFVKDHTNLNATTLRWVAATAGALLGGGFGFMAGGEATGDLATNAVLGAVAVTGTHSLLLQDSVLGKVIKAAGAAFFKEKPPTA